MPDATSRQRQRERQPEERKEFGRILKERRESLPKEDGLTGKTVGYDRFGRLRLAQVMPRTYN